MADQNITALPVATSPASSDQLLLVGATEEKLIDYDKLADAILTKLTSKQYTLDQGTKTLPAALNELNSNSSRVEYRLQFKWHDDDGKYPGGLKMTIDESTNLLLPMKNLTKME